MIQEHILSPNKKLGEDTDSRHVIIRTLDPFLFSPISPPPSLLSPPLSDPLLSLPLHLALPSSEYWFYPLTLFSYCQMKVMKPTKEICVRQHIY